MVFRRLTKFFTSLSGSAAACHVLELKKFSEQGLEPNGKLCPRCHQNADGGRGQKEEKRDGGREGERERVPEGLLTESCDACMGKVPGSSAPGCCHARWHGAEPLPSSQLFTWEGLIGKEMSPRCEYVTKAGAEVTSLWEERGSRGGEGD